MTAPDPGPPPARGLVVRSEGSGFHARVWPAPPAPIVAALAAAVACGAAGAGLTFLVGEAVDNALAVSSSLALFGAVGVVAAWVPRLVPVEVQVDDEVVYWNGERYPWSRVSGARAVGPRLELLGPDGAVVDHLPHLRPDVSAWLAAALVASLPAPSVTSSIT